MKENLLQKRVFFLNYFMYYSLHDREKGSRSQFRITALDERDCSEDSAYWLSYSSLLSENKERVWDALLDGLEKYRSGRA